MVIDRNFILPEKCERGLTDCNPLSIIKTESSFVCCGLNKSRSHVTDIFRHCFKNNDTDSIYDVNYEDMLSTITIFSNSMHIERDMNK